MSAESRNSLKVLTNHVMWLQDEINRLEKVIEKLEITDGPSSVVTVLDLHSDSFGRVVVTGKDQAESIVIQPLLKNVESLPENTNTNININTNASSAATAALASTTGRVVAPKRLRLSNKSFTLEAAQHIAPAIESIENLREADLSDIIAGRMEDEALEVLGVICGTLLKHKSTLRVLDLSDNALGEKGVRKLEPVISQLTLLQEIRFKNNGLSALSMSLLLNHLQPARRSLKKIVFDNNMSGDGGAKALADFLLQGGIGINPSLKEICMSSSRVRGEGGMALIQAIGESLPNLEKLDLTDSMVGIDGAKLLAHYLKQKKLQKLKVLCLRDAGLEQEGLDIVANVLSDKEISPLLEVIDLTLLEVTGDQIEGEVGKMILSKKETLKELILDENNEIEAHGAEKLAEVILQCKHLQRVSLKECELDDEAKETLEESKKQMLLLHDFVLDVDDEE